MVLPWLKPPVPTMKVHRQLCRFAKKLFTKLIVGLIVSGPMTLLSLSASQAGPMDYNSTVGSTSESVPLKTRCVPICSPTPREYVSHFPHFSAVCSMVSVQSLLTSDPPEEEWPYVYQTRRDHDRPGLWPSRTFTDLLCNGNATTLINDDEHLRADTYKPILSPENPSSNDPDPPSADYQSLSLSNHPLTSMQLHLWPSRPRSLYHTQLHLHLPCRTNRLGLSSFLEGTMTRLPADQMLHAKCMLDSTKWTFSHICALAQRFSWKCTTPNTYGSIARTILILYGHQLFSSPRIALEAFDYARSTIACQNVPPKAGEVDDTSNMSCFVAERHKVDLFQEA